MNAETDREALPAKTVGRILYLYEIAHWTMARIAREMNIPRLEVRRVCWTHTRRAIRVTPPLSPAQIEAAYRMREEGRTWREIADALGTTLYRVRNALKDIRAWGRQTPRQIEEIVRAREVDRLTWDQVCERTGVGPRAAMKAYRRTKGGRGHEQPQHAPHH